MGNSFKATNLEIQLIKDHYDEFKVDDVNELLLFKASCKDFSVLVYNNNTVLFQGKKASEELARWHKEEVEIIDHVGSDEVGVGDYFGPIVVTSSLVKKEDYEYLINLGVKDSKKLNDETIRVMASKIKERIKTVTFVLSNEKYNELTENDYNLNKLKAYMHNFVLYKIVNNNNFKGKIIVDQFCEEALYYRYLADYKTTDIQKNIFFTTKAESKYLAVAASSIVARDTFLRLIDEMSNEVGHKIILGASDKVDDLAKEILEEKGPNYLKKHVKWHFKNTLKITDKLK